jgi:hypothetical protein
MIPVPTTEKQREALVGMRVKRSASFGWGTEVDQLPEGIVGVIEKVHVNDQGEFIYVDIDWVYEGDNYSNAYEFRDLDIAGAPLNATQRANIDNLLNSFKP